MGGVHVCRHISCTYIQFIFVLVQIKLNETGTHRTPNCVSAVHTRAEKRKTNVIINDLIGWRMAERSCLRFPDCKMHQSIPTLECCKNGYILFEIATIFSANSMYFSEYFHLKPCDMPFNALFSACVRYIFDLCTNTGC